MGVENERRLEPGHARGQQTADPAALGRREAMQETRIGRTRRPPDSQPNEKKNSHRRDQFAEQIDAQERLDVFGRSILDAGKFRPHLLGPDRHHEEPQRRVIEIIIVLVGVRPARGRRGRDSRAQKPARNPAFLPAKAGALQPASGCPNKSRLRCPAGSADGSSVPSVCGAARLPRAGGRARMIPSRIRRARSDAKICAGRWRHSIRCQPSARRAATANKDRASLFRQARSKNFVEHAEEATNLEWLCQIISGAGRQACARSGSGWRRR